jgi:hypothetical protein
MIGSAARRIAIAKLGTERTCRRGAQNRLEIVLAASHALPNRVFWETSFYETFLKQLILLARSDGFEPPTLRFEV